MQKIQDFKQFFVKFDKVAKICSQNIQKTGRNFGEILTCTFNMNVLKYIM